MVTESQSKTFMEEESPLGQPLPESEWGDYYLPAGCGEEQYMNQCVHCGCPMGKHPTEDLMAPPETNICGGCATRHSGV